MTGKRNETLAPHLKYPMVDLLTGGTVMPLIVRKRSDDMVPLISHCSVGTHGSMA